MRIVFIVPATALLAACSSIPAKPPQGSQATFAILETTDLHANVRSYDYYKLAPDASLGLERTATLIRQARKEFPNSLLLDNGDTIQGTALGDYQALVSPVGCGQALAIYKAMNALGFEGGSVGNHEFNWGLDFLGQVSASRFGTEGANVRAQPCAGPAFPVVLANVVDARTGRPLFEPYRIIEKQVSATGPNGKPLAATVKVGIIGFTTPAIMGWDKRWLEGRVRTEGWRETAQRYIPEMRAKGAEVIVAISHAGLDGAAYAPSMENGSLYLAQEPGIDALLLGHSHDVFPNAASKAAGFNLPGVDKVQGRVHGVPTVMPGLWGKHLGVIQLALRHDGQRWIADASAAKVETRGIQRPDRSFVEPDPEVAALVKAEHEATIAYVKTPIGDTDFRMSAYFADVGDVSAIQVVNQAQADYVRRHIQANMPQYAQLPVLSMSAPFKTGAAGVADYTDVAPGKMALNNAADLYLYPNDLHAVKVDGATLKAWLEKAAGRFNTIDPTRSEPQELVNAGFAGFNFDMLTDPDVRYQIDVTQAPGQRIKGLSWRGQPVRAEQEFIVATNNFRASGGGGFPGLDGGKTIFASPDTNRAVLIAYIKSVKHLTRTANGSARSWSFAVVKTKGPVVFRSAPGKLALAREAGLDNIQERGEGLYEIWLDGQPKIEGASPVARDADFDEGVKALTQGRREEAITYFRRAAQRQYAFAEHVLGLAYFHGDVVEKDLAMALNWFRLAAEHGNAGAMHAVGNYYEYGWGVAADPVEALKWQRRAADRGNKFALFKLAIAYRDGELVPQDLSRSAQLMKAAAKLGEANPQAELAKSYLYGLGVEVDYREARYWAELAAEQGNRLAWESLGEILFMGLGTAKDEETAVSLFQRLADADDRFVHAKFRLAQAFLEGRGAPKDPAKGLSFLLQVAPTYRAAEQYFASLYAEGELVPRNDEHARQYFERCVAAGSAACQYSLGNRLAQGRDGKVDLPEAARLYGLSGSQGYGPALNNLGDLYETGRGVPINYGQAMEFYKRAANVGTTMAFWNIGNLFDKGWGVPQNSSLAYTYIRLALKFCETCKNWEDQCDAIARKLSAAERRNADAVVTPWKKGDALPGFSEASASPAGRE